MSVIKSERVGIEKKFLDLCLSKSEEEGLCLYDIEYLKGSQTLRVYIMNPESKTAVIEDCIKMDHALSPAIEDESWMPSELVLEVSSPGMYRHLSSVQHFRDVVGKNVLLQMMKKLSVDNTNLLPKELVGQKKIIVSLKEVNNEEVIVSYKNNDFNLKYENIKKANLEVEMNLDEK